MRSIPSLYTLLLVFGTVLSLRAQGYEIKEAKTISDEERVVRGDKLRGYRLLPDIGMPIQTNVLDTITLGTHGALSAERRGLGVAYKGNYNSPWQSRIFFDREARPKDFVYFANFQGMEYDPRQALWYDTKTPFTFVHYHKNFQNVEEEEILKGTLSLNLGKRINLGTSFNYTGAQGFYTANRSKDARYRVFGSYRSDRYDAWAYVANDYYRMSEHGGIADLEYLLNPEKFSSGRVRISSRDIPTRVPSDMLYNRLRSGHFFLSHRYKLGYHREIEQPADSLKHGVGMPNGSAPLDTLPRVHKEFVPVGSISHTIYYNKQSRRFISRNEHEVWKTLFGEPAVWLERQDESGNVTKYVLPNDTAAITTLHNTLALSLLEGFRPWVKFGLSAYVRTEQSWVSIPNRETGAYKHSDHFFSSFVGAEAARQGGQGFNFRLKGELGILGKDLGAFDLMGKAQSKFSLLGKSFGLTADARLLNVRPPYFVNHHHGTFGWWNQAFDFMRRLEFGGRINLGSWGTWVEARTASLLNYIYWGQDARPHQQKSIIQMSMIRLGHRYKLGPLRWDLEAAYQVGTQPTAIPLPDVTMRADVYIDVLLAKVLGVQLGVEGYWHTAYYAPYYDPTHQQYTPQTAMKIGGETPLLTAYANMRLKGTRFYVRMFNVAEALWDNKRLSAHLYPYNPMHIQAGIAVDLEN